MRSGCGELLVSGRECLLGNTKEDPVGERGPPRLITPLGKECRSRLPLGQVSVSHGSGLYNEGDVQP